MSQHAGLAGLIRMSRFDPFIRRFKRHAAITRPRCFVARPLPTCPVLHRVVPAQCILPLLSSPSCVPSCTSGHNPYQLLTRHVVIDCTLRALICKTYRRDSWDDAHRQRHRLRRVRRLHTQPGRRRCRGHHLFQLCVATAPRCFLLLIAPSHHGQPLRHTVGVRAAMYPHLGMEPHSQWIQLRLSRYGQRHRDYEPSCWQVARLSRTRPALSNVYFRNHRRQRERADLVL
jgi:hypothetical protein